MAISQNVLKIGDKGQEVIKLYEYLKTFGMKTTRIEVLGRGFNFNQVADEPKYENGLKNSVNNIRKAIDPIYYKQKIY